MATGAELLLVDVSLAQRAVLQRLPYKGMRGNLQDCTLRGRRRDAREQGELAVDG